MERNNNEGDKEKKPGCWQRFSTSMRNAGHFLYNSSTGEVMGRSGSSWAKILTFYVAFYAILAGFWAACMVAFISTLDPNVPTMQKMYSMLKDNPGMSYEPFFKNSGKTLIAFDPSNHSSYDEYVQQLSDVYYEWGNKSLVPSLYKDSCEPGNGATAAQACMFNMSVLGDSCTPENSFGFSIGKPCIMLRINKVFYWEPNNITFDKLPCDLSSPASKSDPNCAKMVEFMNLPNNTKTNYSIGPSSIAVSCNGENDGDADNIVSVTFYPPNGFPAYFYPYFNQPNFTSPLVMAQFDVIEGRVSMILCQVWTRDIIHNQVDLQASIHFELMVSNKL